MGAKTAAKPAGRHAARKHVQLLSVLIASMVFLGSCVAFYPSAASWFSALEQTKHTDRYVDVTDSLAPYIKQKQLREAQQYNASLADGTRIVDPFAAVQKKTQKTNDPYWDLLDPNDDGLMARLRIPSIDVKIPVYHGTAEDVLLEGAGHLEGTALPVGGQGTHAVMTGHRGLPQAAMFTDLDKVTVGDDIEIDVYGQTLVYRIIDSSVVLPTETALLRPQVGRDLISLVTCTPIGVNSHRIIVTAERVLPTPADAGQSVDSIGFPWWALGLGLSATGCLWYVFYTRSQKPAARV